MTQKDFIKKLAKNRGCNFEQAELFLDAFVTEMYELLEKNDKVAIRGLCTFKAERLDAGYAKCPHNNKTIWYQPKVKFTITPCSKFKEYLTVKLRKNEPHIAEPI